MFVKVVLKELNNFTQKNSMALLVLIVVRNLVMVKLKATEVIIFMVFEV